MNLTKHFTLEEFEYSATAIRHGIENKVPQELIPSLRNLCEQVLEPLRQHFNTPITISYDQLLLEQKGNILWLHISCKPNPANNRRQFIY